MKLDMTITLGNVIQLAGGIAALYLAYVSLRERLVKIETQLEPLWQEFIERRNGGHK